MTIQAIIASFPVSSSGVSQGQQDLVHKKISGAALTPREKWHHAISMTSSTYKNFYEKKVERVLTLHDGIAKIYDATKEKIVGILSTQRIGFIAQNGSKRKAVETVSSQLTFNETPFTLIEECSSTNPLSNPNSFNAVLFSREFYTDYAAVKDVGNTEVEIFEQEIAREGNVPLLNIFRVNLRFKSGPYGGYLCNKGHMHTTNNSEAYFGRQILPQVQVASNTSSSSSSSSSSDTQIPASTVSTSSSSEGAQTQLSTVSASTSSSSSGTQ